jgi:VWFA-related protein
MARLALPVALLAAATAAAQQVRFKDRVDVERVVVDVRVLDGRGRAIEGLTALDFRVKVDGRAVPVESVQWLPAAGGATSSQEPLAVPAPSGRLVVFFVQKDMETSRLTGLFRMQREAARLADALGPVDRAAVVRYEKSLTLLLDFTADRHTLRRRLGDVLREKARRRWEPGPVPSLAAHLDVHRARRAATPERALQVTAEALGRLPGPKVLVMLGWGLGRYDARSGIVRMEPDYAPARRALLESRTAVFSLDVTNADYHSLEVGLAQVAEDTGGFYEKTHLFTGPALDRLAGALAGHYLVSFEGPSGPGRHRIEFELVGRRGLVLAKRSYGEGS